MRMMFLAVVFVATLGGTAQARLGETPDQLVQRYGPPLSENDQKGEGEKIALADVVFQKGGFQVNVTVVDGISVQEDFKKINGQPLSVSEVRILLAANSQGQDWNAPRLVNGVRYWTRDDNATARMNSDGSLSIKSRELAAKEAVAKKLETAPSLDGF